MIIPTLDLSDQGWHRYRLTMNESEVEEHRIESGEEFLLITAKVTRAPARTSSTKIVALFVCCVSC